MSYNELYSRVACLPDARNVLDFAGDRSREAQTGYSTSARSLGLSTPKMKDGKNSEQFSNSLKNNFQRTHRCIRAHCGNEGIRLVAKTEIPFLSQLLENEVSIDLDSEIRLCANHYREFREANLKNLHASRKYDLLTPSMDPPSLYETEVHVRELETIDMEPEEPELRNEMPIDPTHAASIVSNVVRTPKGDTFLDRTYHFVRRCCYGDPADPCVSETSNQLPKVTGYAGQQRNQPLQQYIVSGNPRGSVQYVAPIEPYPTQTQTPSTTYKQTRDPVILQSRNLLSPNPTRQAPLQHSLATSGINRRFGGGQNSEFQSPLFKTG